jgi:hypothetical protein
MRGRLCWREGDWDGSEELLSSARELAEKIGWSEVSFSALMALAATQRDRGELERAEATLGDALAVFERAGLVPQSVQAHAALTLIATLAEHRDPPPRPPVPPTAPQAGPRPAAAGKEQNGEQ